MQGVWNEVQRGCFSKMIKGMAGEYMVYVDGQPLDLEASLKVANHSPTGFMWGYLGSGPSQTALALLLHFGATKEEALAWYQDFKRDVVAPLKDAATGQPLHEFEMVDSKVADWLEARRIFARELERGNT